MKLQRRLPTERWRIAMRKAVTGALAGLCLGAVLGYVLYSVAYDDRSILSGWTAYGPYSTQVASPSGQTRWFSTHGLIGMLLGGGLAAIAGAVIGGTGAVVEAIRETRRLALSLERQQMPHEKEHHA